VAAHARSNVAGVAVRAAAGALAGVAMVTVGYQLARVTSRWALDHGLAQLDGPWLVPRFVAWFTVASVSAAILWGIFGRRSLLPAIVAAASLPILYAWTFVAFFGVREGLALTVPYAYETVVVFAALPGTIWWLRRRHGD
jgi:hypothetical protein